MQAMNVVEQVRRRAGLTQQELARRAGTSQPTIAAYESGAKSPTWRTVRRLAHAAGVDVVPLIVPPLTREDRRSLALHEAIAARLVQDPREVVQKASANLVRMRQANPGARALLDEWDSLLRLPVLSLADVMTDPRPHARELRHVTPFAGVLSARERAAVYADFRQAEGAA